MATRKNPTRRSRGDDTASSTLAATADTMEQRVLAFAGQIGRIAGTVQARTEGWLDRQTLQEQITSVRDGAIELLAHIAPGAIVSTTTKPPAVGARLTSRGRSGGVVDAPGKKHRRPPSDDPDAPIVGTQKAKMRAAKPMVKTNRRRGRG